ncbi:MAG: decaprenyl-phosphate phosphoribosyltransferase [Bacteroidota bacterium]
MATIAQSSAMKVLAVIQLIRVHQWVKNLFVFLPAFFAVRLDDPQVLINSLFAFLAFSVTASSIYVINDYLDIEKDKLHPEKKSRPLASGALSKPAGLSIFAVLAIISIGLTFLIGWEAATFLGAYFVMNLAYSFKLKEIAIIDIAIISTGFLLRVFVGGAAASIPVSNWLVLLTFLLAMLLALAKRRGEMVLQTKIGKTRKSLEGYNLQFIDQAMVFMAAVTVVSYIMYTVSPEVMHRIKSDRVYLSTIFVILGVMRYLQQTLVFHKTESPTKVLYEDRFIQLVLIAWIGFFAALLYI